MTREYEITFICDHPCVGTEPHECLHQVIWTPDGVNEMPAGWYVDYEGYQSWVEDEEPADICDPCWAIMESETPHKEGE